MTNVVNDGPDVTGAVHRDHDTIHNSAPGDEGGEPAPFDFAFFDAQTFGDPALQRELFDLFLAQADDVLPRLSACDPDTRATLTHRLKGSCQGIGAFGAARAAQAVEDAEAAALPSALRALTRAFARARSAIASHPASPLR